MVTLNSSLIAKSCLAEGNLDFGFAVPRGANYKRVRALPGF